MGEGRGGEGRGGEGRGGEGRGGEGRGGEGRGGEGRGGERIVPISLSCLNKCSCSQHSFFCEMCFSPQGIPYSHDMCPCVVCFYPNVSCAPSNHKCGHGESSC